MPEYVASRKPCKDFEKYEHLFKDCQEDLRTAKRKVVKFQNEQQIKKGYYFILKGVLLYVKNVGETIKSSGKVNARLELIFENGTQSDMLLRSLSAELYKHGKRVSEYDEANLEGLYEVNEKLPYSPRFVVKHICRSHQPTLRPKPAKELAYPNARQTEKMQQK